MFTNNAQSFLGYFWPETILITGILLVLLWEVLYRPAPRAHAAALTIGTLVGSMVAMALVMMRRPEPASLFGGLMVWDPFAAFFKAAAAVTTALAVLLAWRARETEDMRLKGSAEFHALLLTTTLGIYLLSSATDLLTIFIGLETVSMTSYVLAGYHRRDRRASEAALKYVIYGGVASGAMLYGMSLMYGATGATKLVEMRAAVVTAAGIAMSPVLMLAATLVIVGFAFKIAAVPFHMWCPDVYEGAPTPVTAFFSVGPKLAGFAVFVRVFYGVFYQPGATGPGGADAVIPWQAVLGVVSVASMTLGNLAALGQTNMKRLLAYSSIAHVGYVLMGLVVATPDGLAAIVFYLVVYLAMNLGAFLVVIAMARELGSKDDPGEDLRHYQGLGVRAPLVAILLAIFLFSLTGLPPLGGFVGKYYLFASVVAKGGVWYVALAVIGILNSALSLYYYAKIVRVMFLEKPLDASPVAFARVHTIPLVALAVPVVVLGLYWGPPLALAFRTVKFIGL
jgi:NADH-quinone oxidoreductase subunit N